MRTLIYGWPKSGSTLLYTLLQKNTTGNLCLFEPPTEGKVRYNIGNPNLIVKTHINHGVVDSFIHKFDNKIFLMRDPRDIIISHFFYVFKFKNKDEVLSAIKDITEKESNSNNIPFHKLIEKYQHITPEFIDIDYSFIDGDWILYKYEDLINGNYNDINIPLDLDIKYNDVEVGHKWIKRTSNSNDWKLWFTDEDVEYYKDKLKPIMDKFGYTDWNIDNNQAIDSKGGSEYVKSLLKFVH